MPVTVVSDRGTDFANKLAAASIKALGTHHGKSTFFHPWILGQMERVKSGWKDVPGQYAVRFFGFVRF